MGEVYRAHDPRLNRDVAIKVLPADVTARAEALARLEREAHAAAALSHPNIVAIYDIGRAGDTLFVVMELLDGETLREALGRGPLDLQRAVRVAASLAAALSVAHSRGIVHRDLKPDNVFLTSAGEVKILDFGLARDSARQDASDETALTMPGTVLGTPGYMSPEQVRGEAATPASDIFSLGCVLYEMVTGRRAFARPTAAESLAALLHESAPDFHSGVHVVPANLQRAITRCLSKDAIGRFESAADLAAALRVADKEDARAALDSLAVLPFANSGSPDTEYLSDGITETLINSFSRLPNLRVVPRSVVFRLKDTDLSPRALGATLGARLLLTGRVMHRGDRLSVQAELVDAAAEQQLWGERFNRRTSDILEVEDEIARQIADRLQMQLSREEQKALAQRSTEDSEAYRLYLKARFHWRKRSPHDLRLALDYFRQATLQDPANAYAHAGLSETYCVLVWYGLQPPDEGMRAAEAAGRQSVQCDPDLADGHAALGFAVAARGDFAAAERQLAGAIKLNPAYYLAHDWHGLLLSAEGRGDEAMEAMHRARQIDPLSPVISHHSAWVYFHARRHDDAVRVSRSALEVDPSFPFGHYWLGIASTEIGDHRTAIDSLERAVELLEAAPLSLAALGHAYGRAGRGGEAEKVLVRLLGSEGVFIDPFHLALNRLGVGDHDGAMTELRRAAAGGFLWYRFYVRCDARLDPLRLRADFPAPIASR